MFVEAAEVGEGGGWRDGVGGGGEGVGEYTKDEVQTSWSLMGLDLIVY